MSTPNLIALFAFLLFSFLLIISITLNEPKSFREFLHQSKLILFAIIRSLFMFIIKIVGFLLISILVTSIGASVLILANREIAASLIEYLSKINSPSDILTIQIPNLAFLALFTVIIFAAFKLAYSSFPLAIWKYSATSLSRTLKSKNLRVPPSSALDLARRYTNGRKLSLYHRYSFLGHIFPAAKPIEDFLSSKSENILTINGKWGVGKTTTVLIAIDLYKVKYRPIYGRNYYIYESAFKYVNGITEFKKDILNSIREILDSRGFYTRTIFRQIAENIGSKHLGKFHFPQNGTELTSRMIYKLNRRYNLRKEKFSIIIIVDDIDRLLGEDIISTLSMLSILRRLDFVKIILPLDQKIIEKQLVKASVASPKLFLEKYLPEQNQLTIQNNFEIISAIITRELRYKLNDDSVFSEEKVKPIFEVVIFKIFDDTAKEKLTNSGYAGFSDRWLDQHDESKTEKETLDAYSHTISLATKMFEDIAKQNADLKIALPSSSSPNSYSEFLRLIHYDNPNIMDEKPYEKILSPWINDFASIGWGSLSLTTRNVIDFLHKYLPILKEGDELSPSDEPNILFAEAHNRLFPVTFERSDIIAALRQLRP